ncbi:PAS domain S-box protein [Halorientalis regularis]|uniref:histidine kinase n=1 Tax=Halorientalis regularis TaxID=660518 RepID=A0A1G7IA56_9EURY|nr:PAS domain S-box protein [Halorientalis regularis]SDF09478.1 PAS domain S-box-containing protein [Halorientalis regularis]
MKAGRVVLYVGTDSAQASSLQEESADATTVERVETVTDATSRLGDVVCVVSEAELADGTGVDLCRTVRRQFDDVAFVLVPGSGSDALAREAVSAGVDEYVPAGTITDAADLWERVLAAIETISTEQRRYRKMVEQASDATAIIDPDATIRYISPSIERILGYAPSELVGRRGTELIHPEDCDDVLDALASSLANPDETVDATYRAEHADGGYRWVESRGQSFIDDPAVGGTVISIRDVTEREERERDLRMYETIVEAVDDLVFALDEDGRFAFANEAHESRTGFASEELIGENPADVLPEAAIRRAREIVANLRSDPDRDSATFEMDLPGRDGETIPCEVHIAVLTDDDGAFRGTAGIVRDISDRKEQEQLYSTLLTEANDGIAITRKGRLQFVNEQMATLVGGTRAEIEGTNVFDLIAPEDHDIVRGNYERRLDQESETGRYEIELETLDGERVPVEVSTTFVQYQGERGEMAIIRAIGDRKERERELELYEEMLNAVPDSVYAVDEDGRFVALNDTACEVVGLPEDELVGTHVSVCMDERDIERGQDLIRDLLTGERGKGIYEMDLQPVDCDPIPSENHVALLTDENGEFRGSVGVLRDVTDRQERERRLTVLNRALRHDLRNSMHVIMANAELVARAVSDQQTQEKLDTIVDRAEQINSLSEKAREIEQTLANHEQTRKPIDLGELLATQVERFRDEYPEATFETDLPAHAWVEATPLIDTAVENLIENSIEHTDEARIQVSLSTTGDAVTVTVADDGPGIPEKERRIVGKGSETPLDHASGLGLWLVTWITRDSGGEVVFEAPEEGGSVVRLVLDKARPPVDSNPDRADIT